jgi:hypothetical protein
VVERVNSIHVYLRFQLAQHWAIERSMPPMPVATEKNATLRPMPVETDACR